MRKLRPRKPLDAGGCALAERYVGYALRVAHGVWRDLHRRAADLEEMRGEALLALTDLVAAYDSGSMPPFEKILGRRVRWVLYRWAFRETRRPDGPGAAVWVEDLDYVEVPDPAPDGRELLLRILEALPPPQKEVLEKRFGLNGNAPLSLVQAAKELGVSAPSVREREQRALTKLRNSFRGGLGSADKSLEELREILAYSPQGAGGAKAAAKNN